MSLQETYAPRNACFGCGPANAKGLRIRSVVDESDPNDPRVVCTWRAEPHHEAFPGVLNGGIIGSLLDCHCNWTAAWHLMRAKGLDAPPCTVTAEYSIQLKRPTPSAETLHLTARVVESHGDIAIVEGELVAAGKVTATCRGPFVAVKEGHPAFHRW